MSGNDAVVGIIPARGGSKGVHRKNIRRLAGKPLLMHTWEAAMASPAVGRVLVNSEDAEIRKVAVEHGAEVQDRPEDFWHDNSVQEVDRLLMWCVSDLERRGEPVDVVVLLYPTAPLRTVEHITQTVERVTRDGFDSALTLYEDTTYLWSVDDGTATPTNYDPKLRGPRQKESWNQWAENKAVYAVRRDLLMETGCRIGGRVGYVEMSKRDSIDIDRPEDFELAEAVLASRRS
jgi:N-acylneuraminate cytidylyltransferase